MGSFVSARIILYSLVALISTAAAAVTKVPTQQAAAANRILRFSPVSDRADFRIDTVNQIRVDFGADMTRHGSGVEPRNADIFNIACSPNVQGRAMWNSARTWIFNFESELPGQFLPGATRCDVTLKKNVKTLAGQAITGKTKFTFVVDGPNIVNIFPSRFGSDDESSTINEDQVFVITTDTIVDQASVLKNVYFLVNGGTKSRVGVEILSGKRLEDVLKAHHVDKDDLPRTLVLMARGKFPQNAKLNLVWDAGVKALQNNVARVVPNIRTYEVRSALRADVSCYRVNANSGCVPLSDIKVQFSAAVPRKEVEQAYILLPNGKTMKPDFDTEFGEQTNYLSELRFRGPFPENGNFKIVLPTSLKDEAGRPLENSKAFPLAIKTAALPPLVKFAAKFGLVEANLGNETGVPVTIRNIEDQAAGRISTPEAFAGQSLKLSAENFKEVIQWLQKINDSQSYAPGDASEERRNISIFGAQDKTSKFSVPLIKTPGKPSADTVALIPLRQPGFYVLEMESKILGDSLLIKDGKTPSKDRNMYVPTAALVTNMVVHVKQGRENSLFWVTKLDSGEPMAGAEVSLFDCNGKQVGEALTTDGNGIARASGQIARQIDGVTCPSGGYPYANGFYVAASAGNDFTFTHSSWDEGIESYRFGDIAMGDYEGDSNGKLAVHTILDRTLLRAGETVSMKHFVRSKITSGLGRVADKDLPIQAVIEFSGDDTKYTLPLTWDKGSLTALSEWKIPVNAKLGSYVITLVAADKQNSTYRSSRFQVQEFKVPLMKGNVIFPDELQVQPGKIDVQVNVSHQNGGGAKGLAATLAYTVEPIRGLSFPGYENFFIGNGGIEAKTTKQGEESEKAREAISKAVVLDQNGNAVVSIDNLKGFKQPQRVEATLEFRDTIGETQTIASNLTVYSSDRLVGIRPGESLSSKKNNPVTVVVLDTKGKPIANAPVGIKVMEEIMTSVRTRGVGGTYTYDTTTVIKEAQAGTKCDNATNSKGLMNCTLTVKPGNYYIVASTNSQGNLSQSNAWIHVSGRADNLYAGTIDDRFDLLPERGQYEAGETAKLEAKIPMQKANVLVTTEREGIMEARVIRNWTPQQFIDVKIERSYAPNVFVSALAVRGRIATDSQDARIDGLVDLAKPAYKLGMTRLEVSRKGHELKVEVTPGVQNGRMGHRAQNKFEPGDEIAPLIKVTDSAGKPVVGEIALAVVDEGLLELLPNRSWDLLTRLLTSRPLDVRTFTAQMQVIGKRHYGLKAVPLGGDGAGLPSQGSTRKLFDTLVKWSGRVKLNDDGIANLNCSNAEVNASSDCARFQLNDSLTKFRVVAIANSGMGLFGTGQSTVISTKDFIIEPSFSAVGRTGDKANTELQVRNTTDQAKSVSVCGTVELKMADGSAQTKALDCRDIQLAAQTSAAVDLNSVELPNGVVGAKYMFKVQDENKKDLDSREFEQKISPNVLTRTVMAELKEVTGPVKVPVEFPASAVKGQGGINVKLMDKLTAGITTVKSRFDNYLFDSIEYRVSRAVATQDKEAWKSAMMLLPALIDDQGLVKFYLESKNGSEVLTAYVLKVARLMNSRDFALPREVNAKMLAGLRSFAEGKLRRDGMPTDKNGQFSARVNAIEVLVMYDLAGKAIMDTLPKVVLTELSNATLIDLLSIYDDLGLKAQRTAIETVLRNSRLNQSGTRWTLQSDNRNWYLLSSHDADTADLIQVVLASQDAQWKQALRPIAIGLVVSSNTRLASNKGSWDTTIANALMANAYRTFSNEKKEPVAGVTDIELASQNIKSIDWSASPKGETIALEWPAQASDIVVNHRGDAGSAAPWALVSSSAAVPVTQAMGAIRIEKSIEAIQQARAGRYSIGDTFKVTLKIKPSAPISQLGLMDPIPAGASILKADGVGDWQADYSELGAEAYRAYFSSVGESEIQVQYRIRLNNSGTFQLPATTVEALYTPEVFGLIPNSTWTIGK